ncbi:MAG: uroporphyrinogen-III synthase [Pseudomonadota bacterium]
MTQVAPPPHALHPPACLVTRPEPEGSRFADLLVERFALSPLLSPLLRVEPVNVSIPVDTARGVILTSAHGARRLAELDLPRALPCYTVGDKTAQVARAFGYQPVSAGGDAQALVALIKAEHPATPLFHLRGEHSRGEVAHQLSSVGILCRDIVVYRQIAQDLTLPAQALLRGTESVILPLFSPRTAALFRDAGPHGAPLVPVAMSAAVAQSLGTAATVAKAPTETAMVTALAQLPIIRAWVEKAGLPS